MVEKGLEGAHPSLFEARVVPTDTGRTLSTATKPKMSPLLVAAVEKHGHDSSRRVDVGHVLAPA